MNTSRGLKIITERNVALFRTLPTPTNDHLPSLMVEVCLVLAPDVNFFLFTQAGFALLASSFLSFFN